MASERTSEDPFVERGSIPLDIDDVHILLQVEQEQIQKRTFTNWVNAQLSKRRPPVAVQDLFSDFRDGSRLLDLLEVMCSQSMSREKVKGVFQHRANIEKALAFLRAKSIKLVNINVPDIMDGKPSIILGLIWTIIMHFHIEELASTLSFSSRQSSLESLASLDTRSTSSSARSSPVPPHGSPLHTRFRISAKKALLLWVREQCHKAGCTLNVKDFKASWRSGVVFLAILSALRPDVVSLSAAKTRSNRQNLEEAFRIAERELHIPRLLDPADVDVRDPDEKSIMTYVAQFLQYSKDTPSSEEDMQVQYLTPTTCISPVNLPCNFTPAVAASPLRQSSATQKAQEVTCWLEQAYQELLEGWESTEGESYAERYHVFQTFVVSFNEQRRPVMPLLTAMKRTVKLSEEQRALRHAWDSLAERLREYKTELDLSLPTPLDTVGRWLLRVEEALADSGDDRQDHTQAAQEAHEKYELFKSCLEEMPRHMKTYQIFQNMDEYGEVVVPTDKLDEIKRRFTSVRVSAKYHGIRMDYQEHRHTVLDLLDQLTLKLRTWKRGYISREAVRVLMKDWNETINKQGLPSKLEGTLFKLRHIANKYTSKSALAGDSNRICIQMKDIEAKTAAVLEEVKMVKGTLARTLAAWESYFDTYSSLHAWLEQGTQTNRHGQRAEVTIEMMSKWSSRRECLNEVGNYLMDVTDPQTSRSVSDDLCRINLMWADFVRSTQFELVEEQTVAPPNPQTLQGLIREATQLLKEPVEVLSVSLQTYMKRLQFVMKKIQNIDLDSLSMSLECSAETVNKLKQATPEVLQTLCEATQVCEELQQSVTSLDGRLAELIHWEVDVREFYDLLKEKSNRHQKEQDSKTRALISRGLQLEGQVVMEEQDLQEMVMSRQKNSPLQYLIVLNMQDRVRATVAQSQEAVGMLSSLGARRERSPTVCQPPQKLFVQEQEVLKGQVQPQPVPMIVVQEYQEERSHIKADADVQIRKASVEDSPLLSKHEPHVSPEDKSLGNLADVVALGLPRRQDTNDTKETMETQPHHLDMKETTDKSRELSTTEQPLTVQQDPTQSHMQVDTQQQTQGQQQMVQIQKQCTSQKQTSFQSAKVKKSQKHAANRPWLQKKGQTELLDSEQVPPQSKSIATVVSQPPVSATDPDQAQAKVTLIQQQQSITVSTSTASQAQVSATDTQAQASNITQTQDKEVNVQQQKPLRIIASSANNVSTTDPVQSESKSVIHTQFQVTQAQQQQSAMQVTQTKMDQVQKQQPVTQVKLSYVDQQPPVSQMLAKEQMPAPVISQKQPQSSTIQQHPHPFTATIFSQPETKRSEMQPQFMTQIQRPVLAQTQTPIVSHTYQYLPEESQTSRHYPTTPVQPYAINQRQPHPVAAQSPPYSAPQSSPLQTVPHNQSQVVSILATQSKSKAPIQPRIISMPQSQPQFYKPPQSQPQVMGMGMGQTHDNIQQPQWRAVTADIVTQSYYQPLHQVFNPSHVPPQAQFQSHPQAHDVTATQSQQWTPLKGGLLTQNYPNIQGLGHVAYPQSQGYSIPQQQSQHWGQFRCEPPVQSYSQTSPQSPFQSFVSSQHCQPVRQSNVASHSSPRVQLSEYQQVQHQVTLRPQSISQEWPKPPESKSQIQFLEMAPQQISHPPWVQPPSQAPLISLASQQPQTQQQQSPQFKPEVPFQVQFQNQTLPQPQHQVLQKTQSREQEQPQHQSVGQFKPPALVPTKPQEPAQPPLQPPTQILQWPQKRFEGLVQIQSQTSQTQSQVKVLKEPQSPVQEQSQKHLVAQVKPSALVPKKPQEPAEPPTQNVHWPQNRFEGLVHVQIQSQTSQTQSQVKVLEEPQSPVQEQPQQHLVAQVKSSAQDQAPPQVYSEGYTKAQVLARNKFEDAKQSLQQQILETINIFKGKITKESLDVKLLNEFLGAVQAMEAFCTPSELRDIKLFAQSVRTQWEACFSYESNLVSAEQQLEALKQLCETFNPEDGNRQAQAKLRECETALAAIPPQSSIDHDVTLTNSGVLIEQKKESSSQKTSLSEKPVEITTETLSVTAQRPKTVEKKEILKQISTEEDRYRSSRFALQAQLNRNEQNMLGDRPSGSATATDLQKWLRELKALQDETESLWSEYETQCSQCSQINERAVEQDRAELTIKWREQRAQLQRRVDSLASALDLMDSIEHNIAEISERLDKFIKEHKDVKGYTLINANLLKDVKDLDESIETQMDRLARFDSEPSHLDLRDRSPLTQLVLKLRSSLDRLRHQVRKSEAAARALDRFLVSLRTLDQDVLFVQSMPCADVTALQDSRSKLALIRKGAASLSDKAPQLDQLLGGAQMKVTQEGSSVTCLDMVVVLVRKLEDADDKLIVCQEELHTVQQSKGLGMRKKTLLVELRKVQGLAEKQGLKEPTIPAVQHRIRALSDLEMQMNLLRPEYESIREIAPMLTTSTEQHDELKTVWDATERAIAERQEQCSTLMELLKKFQSCRAFLGNILQRAEQTTSEQASYISKDNLQRLISRVDGIKKDLSGLGPKIEEFRAVCRQLQSQLMKLPEFSEAPFETEADALVDSWLDLSEKTDTYSDSLCMGLEVWEKQLMLGEEVEVWASVKLVLFSESHPFSSEKEVFNMKDEIQTHEQSIKQFHRKSLEIQELLQGKEAPLELQVMETALKKKLEQVKELFDSCTEVFQELLSVRAHLLQRIDACQTAIQRIHSSVRILSADNKDLLQQHLQDLSDQLLDQEKEADSLMKEVELMSSVTVAHALEEPSNKSKRLKDNIAVTWELINQKKELGEKNFLVQSIKAECQKFEDWLQDAQLAVNECFENPETREDVEASMQRLQDFLASEEGEQRLVQVKAALEKKGQEEVPAETQAELCVWQKEQEGELTTLRAHCQGRHKQLEDMLIKLNSLQLEHEFFQEWLRQRETLPGQREELRQVHENFLKESGRIEAFSDLLASVRLKGLRRDPVLRDGESLVDRYHSLGIRLENQSQFYKSLEKEVEIFHVKEEKTKAWLKTLKQSLESLDKDSLTEENLLKIQAVLDLRVEGESKMAALAMDGESLCSHEEMEESVRQDLIWILKNIDDEWRRVVDLAQQLKAQSDFQQKLLKELEALQEEEKNTRSWIDKQMRTLDFLDEDSSIQERHNKLQEVLSLKDEGDSKLITLRKKGESIYTHDERKKRSIEQSHKELEVEWLRVLQTAQEMTNQINREESLSKELESFQDQLENTQAWIGKLKVILQSIDKECPAEEIVTQAQIVLVHGPEGDAKLSAVKHTVETLCIREGFKEDSRRSIQQTQRALEQEWREVLDLAQILRNEAETRVALDKELRDFNSQEEIFQTWLKELQEKLESLDRNAPPQEILVISQTILNLQPEAELKISALKDNGENLCKKLDESRREFIQQTLKDVQERLRMLMEIAHECQNQAQVQDSLSRDLQNFHVEEKNIKFWVEELKQDLVSVGKSTHGTQEKIEERLKKTQAVLTLRAEGNCKMSSLKRKTESLCGREDLDVQTRRALVQDLKSLEEEWKVVLQNAQELYSLLKNVVERLVSCQCQRQQTQCRVEQLKEQAAALPRHFPWPGLGDRRHAVEQAMAFLDKARSLSPTLSALRALGREMSQLTRDPSWTDPSWAAMEECISGLIKDLMEFCKNLEEGIDTERNCIQLVEQHSAAQDWLREQVKGFVTLPNDRHGLQESISTLKALLQTVEREEREMKELDSSKDALINLCTPGGRDALTLETGHLYDLCAASKMEIKERLIVCETRLASIELKISERADHLRAQAECILNDLRAQECQGFGDEYKNHSQLQENWNILKSCKKELDEIEGRVRDLSQAMHMVPSEEDLPSNIVSLIDTVAQQYCRLQSKLSDRQNECANCTVQCMRETLQALRSWTQSTHTQPPIDSAYTIQEMIENGAVLHKNLQEALSHKQLLMDCLGHELNDKLERDGSNALKDADTLIVQLRQRLQDLEEERMETKAHMLSLETQTSHSFSEQVSCEWPSTLNTTTKVVHDWSEPQDISSAPLTSGSVVKPIEMEMDRDAMSVIEDTPLKTFLPLKSIMPVVLISDNQADDTLTTPKRKSGVSKVTSNEYLLTESPTAEPLLVFAVDEYGSEIRTDDFPNTTVTSTSQLDEPIDVAKFESLRADTQSIYADIQDLESATEKAKPFEELEERALPLNTPVCTDSLSTKLSIFSEEIDFTTVDWSLTALHFDQSKLNTDGLSTTAFAVQSDIVAEVDESGIGLTKDEGKFKMAMKGIEKIQSSAFCGELHDDRTSVEVKSKESIESNKSAIFAQSLYKESDTVEKAHKIASDNCEDEKMAKKKIAALILDRDTVHIHTTEVPDLTDRNVGSVVSAADTGFDTVFSQQVERLATFDKMRKESDTPSSLDQQELEDSGNAVDTKSSQLSDENVDLQTEVLSGQTSEIHILTRSTELNTTHAEREGNWTTTNGPTEVQRAMDPLEHCTLNNGPRETQRRYVILERREELEICQEPAAEAYMPGLNAATSKPCEVVTDVYKLEITETVARGDGKRIESNALNESKTLEIIETLPVPPARRKPEHLSFSAKNEVEKIVDKVILEVESIQKTTEKGETKPTKLSRQSKESQSLSDSSEVQFEEEIIPVSHSQQCVSEETHAEVLPTPPNRRHKKRLTDETVSLDLDFPTPPERKQKEKIEDQQFHLEETGNTTAVENLVNPTPPLRLKVRQAESDSTTVVSKIQEVQETLAKPTPPTRKRDSRTETESVSGSSDLDKTRTKEMDVEESLEKPTPPVRRKSGLDESAFISPLLSKPKGAKDIHLEHTPPTQKKDVSSEKDIECKEMDGRISKSTEFESTFRQGSAVEELFVKPTPPVRRKGSRASQILEMEETFVKPTPPTRRRESKNFSDVAYEELARKMSGSTDMGMIVTQEKAPEETLIKPTPPVRRKVSSQIENDSISLLSKIQEVVENVVKPTSLTRRRSSRNVSDNLSSKLSSSTDLEKTGAQEKDHTEPLPTPSPPVRWKASQFESTSISDKSKAQELEATLLKPTPPIRRRNSGNITDIMASRISCCSLENLTLVTPERAVEDTLVKPTPPVRRKTSRAESDFTFVSIKDTEETLVKPSPPTRKRDSRNVSDTGAIKISRTTDLENSVTQKKSLEELLIKPTPPVRRKTSSAESDYSLVSKTQEMEETLVKPTPPTRRKENRNLIDMVSKTSSSSNLEKVPEETPIKPIEGKQIENESNVISLFFKPQDIEETLEKPTHPTRRRDSRTMNDSIAQNISVTSDLETQARDAEEALIKPALAEDTPVKLTPPTRRRASRNVAEIVPREKEDNSALDTTRTQEKPDMEVLVKLTTSLGQEINHAESITTLVDKHQETEETLEKPTSPTYRRDSRNMHVILLEQTEVELSSNTDLAKTATQDRADVDILKSGPLMGPKASQADGGISNVDKTQDVTQNIADIVPKEIEGNTDLDTTWTQEKADLEILVKPTISVGQELNQAESDSSFVDKPQEVEKTLPTPLTCTRDCRNINEIEPNQTKDEFSGNTYLDKTAPLVGCKASQAEIGISILDETQGIEETLRKQEMQENADMEDLVIPILQVEKVASQPKSGLSSVVFNSQEKYQATLKQSTPLTRTESEIMSDEVSQSDVHEGLIEPSPSDRDDEVEHESIKVTSVSTEPQESLPKPTTPTDQKKDTTITDLNTISVQVEEPPVEPTLLISDVEKTLEVQPVIKQDDEQPEKKLSSALGMESTEDLTEPESLNLVEAQFQEGDKSEISSEDASFAKSINVSEVLKEKKEEEEPLGATMNIIFAEIEKMSKTRPNSLLIESRPYDDPLDVLNTSDVDLETQLHRLVLCILSCRNRPAVLNPTDMAKQVEEAEFCRQSAQKQVSSISKQDHVNGDVGSLATGSASDPEAMQRLSCQWTEALWDVSGTVHTKEAQLQLVIDYDRQMQKAKATLEKLAGELESLKMYPVESSFVEEQRLRSFLRTMEQERTILGELIQTHCKLSPHLSQHERAASQLQQSILQCEWNSLERATEKTLHNVSAYTKESFDLLEDVHTLKDNVENFHKILGSPWISSAAWNSKRAQETIELRAELTAAKQRYFDLHQSFEALSQGCSLNVEVFNIQQGLWSIKDHMDLIGEELASSFPTSNNPTMVRIITEITEALAWAKKTEYDIQSRQKKISLLPEGVHRQIKDWKKLHSEMTSKQTELTNLTEEVTKLIPDLDKPEVSMVTSFLKLLASLSKSSAEKLTAAMEEIQLSLQTREKISEQIAHVESWILCHLHKESLSREDFQCLSTSDLDRRLHQSQDTLCEAENHSGITEALLMKSKDIASELSISENAWLYEKLTNLQEDIKGIINYEKLFILEITEILKNQKSSEQKIDSLEQKLRQIMKDIKDHTFPITKETLSAIEPFKRVLMEHKFQAEQINTSAESKRRELLCVISELHHKLKAFHIKAQIHERFLSLKQRVEDLQDNVALYVPKAKNESIAEEERYKICQTLLTQIPLLKLMYKEAFDELANISSDLYPSQLTTEQERLKQNMESLNAWELAIENNLQNVEWHILKDIHYISEQKAVQGFLREVQQVLEMTYEVESNQEAIEDELRKFLKLKKKVEARLRVLVVLEIKNGYQQGSRNAKDIAELAKRVLDKCEQRLVDLSKAKESLKSYSREVRNANQFLLRTESVLLPSVCSPSSCSERLKDVQQALLTLDKEFQSHIAKIHSFSSPLFSAQNIEQLQIDVFSRLLVRMSALKAQAQLRLEALERCVNKQKSTRVCYEEMCRRIRDAETTLAECASKNITSQTECYNQQEKIKTLIKEIGTLPGKLDELREWCPVQGCYSNRDNAVNSLWGQVARLRHCAKDLLVHSECRGEEWIRIGTSIEKASAVLEQMETELPDSVIEKATAEELQDLLQFWSPYQDRLDCEHRALSALELRVARLLRVPSHLEQAPPIPLCQELQTMQERYHSLKSRSAQGCKAVQAEIKERMKVCEELQGIREWLVAAAFVLSELDKAPKTERLQELHSELCTQKAVLQRIMEGLRMKYSDMYTLVPVEIDGPLQEVSHSLQEVVKKVDVAVQKSGPLHRLDAKLSEINMGLNAVQSRLMKKCPNVDEAESTQKRVWDDLNGLHSRLQAVDVELQDLSEEKPEEVQALKEKISRTQELHTHLSKQAEDRTGFLNKIRGWLQEQDEMVKGSQSWITESQSWLTLPYTYTTAKCLDSHVNALQMVLDDSAQIRQTLQGFECVLKEMASVCDVSGLQKELLEADRRVADMQSSLLEPLKTLEHAAAEVDAMESEVRIMENDVTDLRPALTSKQGISQDKFRAAINRIELMKRTVDELKSCKTGLRLPEGAESTLTVFSRADLLLNKLLELEQLALEHTVVVSEPCEISSTLRVPPTIVEEEPQDSVLQQGQVEIVRVTDDVLTRSGAVLMSVKEATLEVESSVHTQDTESGETAPADSTEQERRESDAEAAESELVAPLESGDPEAASIPEASVRTQSPPRELVTNTPFVKERSTSPSGGQQKCVVS